VFHVDQKSFIGMDVSEPYPATVATDDAYVTQFFETVPLIKDSDGPCTTECDSGDSSAEVEQEVLQHFKQEPDHVLASYFVTVIKYPTCDNHHEFICCLFCYEGLFRHKLGLSSSSCLIFLFI